MADMWQRALKDRLGEFVLWNQTHCRGDEKGEGQIFFERLLRAFGNRGVQESGATCEYRIKKGMATKKTKFADLVWPTRVLIELKKRGEPLGKHYDQAFDYWTHIAPGRPAYMVLCNFDEFWIFDLNNQLHDPVHKLKTKDLTSGWGALKFLLPNPEKPVFSNNNVEVTERAAKAVGSLFLSLQKRQIERGKAQRLVLQIVVALYSEHVGLLPDYTFLKILQEAIEKPSTQKNLTDLFRAMATSEASKKPSRFRNIDYFNGGIFSKVDTVELTFEELDILSDAAKENWARVRPSIFGSIFESSIDPDARHSEGIHYTSELDIIKIVLPTIIRPFRERIEKAKTRAECRKILSELSLFRVLDPACGSGNFLFLAFYELRRLERDLLEKAGDNAEYSKLTISSVIHIENFFGIDTNSFAVELAKVALSIGRKITSDEFGIPDTAIPFCNLDKNIVCGDALFSDWPACDAIIGNPPFQSKNKMQQEFGTEYRSSLREKYPDIPGRADYCVYWIRRAHDHLKQGQHAGLVGTNTIRQNESREGGLDYVVNNGGTILDSVGTQAWSGDAAVHVSIVNWVKGKKSGPKKLMIQKGHNVKDDFETFTLEHIPPTLSPLLDVSSAKPIKKNRQPKVCFQGQTHGHEGFLLTLSEYKQLISRDKSNGDVIFPFLIGNEMLTKPGGKPQRYVIDFGEKSIQEAMRYKAPFSKIEKKVLPAKKEKAEAELKRNAPLLKKNPNARVNRHHKIALEKWWQLFYRRTDLINTLKKTQRYIACSRVTKRGIFDFVSSNIHPNDKVQAFCFDDDYSFGVISSNLHWVWFVEKCTTLGPTPNYNAESIWDTFPWPQKPTLAAIKNVASCAVALREYRNQQLRDEKMSLRKLYSSLDRPGKNELRDLHAALDAAVIQAYGFEKGADPLACLLALNKEVSENEANGRTVQGPGLPASVKDRHEFVTKDCINV